MRDGPESTERRMNCARKNQYRRKMPPFGKTVMYMQIAATRQRRKFDGRWDTGISLNSIERSNMLLVGTTGGVFKVNYIPKKLPAIQSGDLGHVKSLVGTVWDPALGRQARVLDVSTSRRRKPLLQRQSCFHEIPNRENQKSVTRRFHM